MSDDIRLSDSGAELASLREQVEELLGDQVESAETAYDELTLGRMRVPMAQAATRRRIRSTWARM